MEVLIQVLNGVQLGLLMFLLAAGLTLTFGIMDLVNLAHGSLYMVGAYIAWTFITWTDSFVLGALLALPATFVVGVVVEVVIARRLYSRDPLDQVLAPLDGVAAEDGVRRAPARLGEHVGGAEPDPVRVHQPPDPVPSVPTAIGVLLDEAVLGELPQVEARLVGRDAELAGDVGGARRARRRELLQHPIAGRVRDGAQDPRVVVHDHADRIAGLRTTICAILLAHSSLRNVACGKCRPTALSPATATSPCSGSARPSPSSAPG